MRRGSVPLLILLPFGSIFDEDINVPKTKMNDYMKNMNLLTGRNECDDIVAFNIE